MGDENDVRVEESIRKVNRYWYRSGVPKRVRKESADSLRTYLVEAADEGHKTTDIIGGNIPVFASRWIYPVANRTNPIFQILGAVSLLVGAISIAGPLVGQKTTGFDNDLLYSTGLIVFGVLAWQRIRINRFKLSTKALIGISVGLGAGFIILYSTVVYPAMASPRFWVVNPLLAAAMAVIGGSVLIFDWWQVNKSHS